MALVYYSLQGRGMAFVSDIDSDHLTRGDGVEFGPLVDMDRALKTPFCFPDDILCTVFYDHRPDDDPLRKSFLNGRDRPARRDGRRLFCQPRATAESAEDTQRPADDAPDFAHCVCFRSHWPPGTTRPDWSGTLHRLLACMPWK